MPYITNSDRKKFDLVINDLVENLKDSTALSGELNYVFSVVLHRIFKHKESYQTASTLISALECIKLEFYRRSVAPYEDLKIKENGDIE